MQTYHSNILDFNAFLAHTTSLSLAIDDLENSFASGDLPENSIEDNFRWILAIAEESVSFISAERDKRKIFDLIFRHATGALYRHWTDWRICLLFATVPLCSEPSARSKLESYIKRRQKLLWGSNHYTDERYQLQELQHLLLETFGCKSAALAYMMQNIDNSRFRRVIIESTIANKQYDKALAFCFEGEKRDYDNVGLTMQWKHFRYTIYEAIGDTTAQRVTALELFQKGNLQYYEQLVKLGQLASR